MKYVLLFSLVILFSIFPQKSEAENAPSGLSIDPVFQEITLKAQDEQAEFFVHLKNNTDQAVTLKPSVVDFGSLDESGGVAFLGQNKDVGQKYALASWMRPEKDSIFLDPHASEALRVVIENRDTFSPGGHYAALLFRSGEEEDANVSDNAVAVQELVSVLVFAKKEGGEIYDLKLTGEEWSKNFFVLPTDIRLRFQNQGNVHVVPRGIIVIHDPLGKEVQKGVINPESSILLPETFRNYATSLRSLRLAWLPGTYTIFTQYRYDGTETNTFQEEHFLLIPWQGIGIGLLLIFFLWILVRAPWKKPVIKEKIKD